MALAVTLAKVILQPPPQDRPADSPPCAAPAAYRTPAASASRLPRRVRPSFGPFSPPEHLPHHGRPDPRAARSVLRQARSEFRVLLITSRSNRSSPRLSTPLRPSRAFLAPWEVFLDPSQVRERDGVCTPCEADVCGREVAMLLQVFLGRQQIVVSGDSASLSTQFVDHLRVARDDDAGGTALGLRSVNRLQDQPGE